MDPSSLKRILVTAFLLGPLSSFVQAAPAVTLTVTPHEEGPVSAPVQRLRETGACRACDLRGRDLSGAHLIGVDLRDADLRGAVLVGANLEGADLSGARLNNADLRRVNLTNAELSGVDLRDAVVINAFAPDVRSEGIRYAGADLTGSHLIYGGGD